MKKTKMILTAILLVMVGMMLGAGISMGVKKQVNEVKVNRIIEQPLPEDNIYLEEGDVMIELTDGSFAIYNEEKQTYMFQPVELGDWDVPVETAQQLENCLKTYMSIKNTGTY